jgi:hypothetical protein
MIYQAPFERMRRCIGVIEKTDRNSREWEDKAAVAIMQYGPWRFLPEKALAYGYYRDHFKCGASEGF